MLEVIKMNKVCRIPKMLQTSTEMEVQTSSEKDLVLAEDYYFKKSITIGVKRVAQEDICTKFSTEKHGKLFNIYCKFRSNRPEVFLVKGVLKICSKLTGTTRVESI